MTIKEALTWAKKLLKERGVEGPEASADFLLRQVLKTDKAYIFAHPEISLTAVQETKYRIWVKRRAKHKPVWYITGKIEFCDLDLAVNQNVLIPRPETELLVERVLEELKIRNSKLEILEVGTGSGAIILSLANELTKKTLSSPTSQIKFNSVDRGSFLVEQDSRLRGNDRNVFGFSASDISPKALSVARKNAKNLVLADKITFKQGDLFSPWKGNKFDIIVANLPYIPHEDMSTLAFDLIHYEPRTALDGGHEGLEIYKRFFETLGDHLNVGGKVFCEIGYDQGEKIQQLVAAIMPKARVTVIGDYADIDRIVIIET